MSDFNPFDGLVSYTYEFQVGKKKHTLECWLEVEEADDSVGLGESWSVFHAYLGGVDISDLLSEEVRQEIIEEACLAFESFVDDGGY
jgi:hypothetical protein